MINKIQLVYIIKCISYLGLCISGIILYYNTKPSLKKFHLPFILGSLAMVISTYFTYKHDYTYYVLFFYIFMLLIHQYLFYNFKVL